MSLVAVMLPNAWFDFKYFIIKCKLKFYNALEIQRELIQGAQITVDIAKSSAWFYLKSALLSSNFNFEMP